MLTGRRWKAVVLRLMAAGRMIEAVRNNRTESVPVCFETPRKSGFFKQFVQVAGTFLRCGGTRFRVP
jgi:hypothetical protein